MKIVFVVLALFVGYNSGVIVSSGVLQAVKGTLLDYILNNTQEILINKTLDKAMNIDEKELYEAVGEDKSVNERSFIFLKQLFKVPKKNELVIEHTQNIIKPSSINDRLIHVNIIPSFTPEKAKPNKQLFVPQTNSYMKSGYYNPPKYELLNREIKHSSSLQKVLKNKNPINPVVLPLNSNAVGHSVDQKLLEYYRNAKKYHHYIMPHHIYSRHRINYKYGSSFPLRRSASLTRYQSQKPLNIEGRINKVHFDKSSHSSSMNDLDDTLLERYIKETLEEDFDMSDVVENVEIREDKLNKAQLVGIIDCKLQNVHKNPLNSTDHIRLDYNISVNPALSTKA